MELDSQAGNIHQFLKNPLSVSSRQAKLIPFFFFTVPGIEPGATCLLGKHSVTELYPSFFLFYFSLGDKVSLSRPGWP